MVFVAVGMLAMIAVVGLAVDGGMEAGNYRQAQNAADAASLAAARQVYQSNATATKNGLCSTPSAPGLVEVSHNGATQSDCKVASITGYTLSSTGLTTYGAVATVNETAPTTVGLGTPATLTCTLGVDEVNGAAAAATPPTASGSVDLASNACSATVAGIVSAGTPSTMYGCSTSASGSGSSQAAPAAGGSCPSSASLNVNVPTASGVIPSSVPLPIPSPALPGLVQQSSASAIPASGGGPPTANDSSDVVQTSVGPQLPSPVPVTVTASSASSGTTTGGSSITTEVSLSNLSAVVGPAAVAATIGVVGVDITATIGYDPVAGFTAKTVCTVASGAVTGQVLITTGGTTTPVPVGTGGGVGSCGFNPVTLPGLGTLQSSPGTPTCSAAGGHETCSIHACFLQVTVNPSVGTASVCLGRIDAVADLVPITQVAGVEVIASKATPTYFLKVLGITGSNPTAVALAMPQQVSDEPDSLYTASPYAVQYIATQHTIPGFSDVACQENLRAPLVPGCSYYISGPFVDVNPGASTAAGCTSGYCWQGVLDASPKDPRGLGTTPVFVKASAAPCPPNVGTQYVLLPVINNMDDTSTSQPVLFWGLFKIDPAGHPHQATLVRAPDPSTSLLAPVIQAPTSLTWSLTSPGAVAVKVVDLNLVNTLHLTLS